jgi:hypothetical protein
VTRELPRLVYLLIVAAAFALMLRLNWPGHLSVDSVLGLHEGRFGVRETWNPALFGWLLGVLDRLHPGGALVAVLDGVLLFGAWAALAALRPRASWLAPLVAVALLATPQALIYPAIVWKDVLFAAASIAGFVVLAFGARGGLQRPLPTLAAAALLFAAAGLFRQNGLILAVFAALALLAVAWPTGVRRAFALAGGWLAGVAALTLVLSIVAQPDGVGPPDSAGGRGVRILQTYDLVGAAALQRDRAMPEIDARRPTLDDRIRADAPKLYSPVRADPMVGDKAFGEDMKALDKSALSAEWLRLVTGDTGLYLRLRADAFRWVFASPDIDKCLPVHLGVTGPPSALKDLGMPPRLNREDGRLFNYVTWFLDTPAMSHVAYAVLALGLAVVFLIRRDPADLVMGALMLGALAFTASFFVISIACDYRYLYVLDVAAITGALYLALDPRLRRAR